MAVCVGGAGGFVFRGVFGLLSLFWFCMVGAVVGCVAVFVPSEGLE
jgi:hypothetical protein